MATPGSPAQIKNYQALYQETQVELKDLMSKVNAAKSKGVNTPQYRFALNQFYNKQLENLDFLKKELNNKNKLVNLNFCLHRENLKSLLNFVELVERYQWQGTIQALEDWSTIKNFDHQDVLNNKHELFNNAIETLKLISKNKRIFLSGKIQELIKKRISRICL